MPARLHAKTDDIAAGRDKQRRDYVKNDDERLLLANQTSPSRKLSNEINLHGERTRQRR